MTQNEGATYWREMMDGAALRSPDTESRISMAFCSSSFLYRATMLDSTRVSRRRIRRRIRLLNFMNLKKRERLQSTEVKLEKYLHFCP